MKTVGIIGGIGPETTIDYYRSIVTFDQEGAKEGNYPQVIINSINMKKLIDLIAGNRLDDVTRYLLAEIEKLAVAGADFAVLASITPHIVFDRIYSSLNWGGAFILFEKVRGPDARFQDILNSLYIDYKLDKGYSAQEIIGKARGLKGVLEPFSTQGNIDLLKRAGFLDIMTVMKYICFEGFLAIK